MPTEADELRAELRDLFERRARGELRDADFYGRVAERSVALSRAVVTATLAPDESIMAEHHVVHSHFRLTQSLLREPEQTTQSVFASERRLIRVRGVNLPTQPVTCDDADRTVIDDLEYVGIERTVVKRQRRLGEAVVGLSVTVLAWLLWDMLAVTGPVLLLLGIAGALHGLLFPTRWIEVVPRESSGGAPFEIHGASRRSARKVLKMVRCAVAPRMGPGGPEAPALARATRAQRGW